MNLLKMRQYLLSVPDVYLVLQLIGKKKLLRALAMFLDSLICCHFICVWSASVQLNVLFIPLSL